MDTTSALLAVAALGFQWGYQPAGDGTVQYTLQLRQHEAEHLASGEVAELLSYVPAEAQPIGSLRIIVGEGDLPREPLSPKLASSDPSRAMQDPNVQPATTEEPAELTETQLRVTKDGGAQATGSGGRYAPAQRRTTPGGARPVEPYVPDPDAAGDLVDIPTPNDVPRVARRGRDAALPSDRPPRETGVQTRSGTFEQGLAFPAPSNRSQEASPPARENANVPAPTPLTDFSAGQAAGNVPPFGGRSGGRSGRGFGAESAAEEEEGAENEQPRTLQTSHSPSDQPQSPTDDAKDAGKVEVGDQDTEDRPWPALIGAVAIAVGFLAGNVFQWRSYLSLRKRYLQLLRKTG